jgi:hypothetical protein
MGKVSSSGPPGPILRKGVSARRAKGACPGSLWLVRRLEASRRPPLQPVLRVRSGVRIRAVSPVSSPRLPGGTSGPCYPRRETCSRPTPEGNAPRAWAREATMTAPRASEAHSPDIATERQKRATACRIVHARFRRAATRRPHPSRIREPNGFRPPPFRGGISAPETTRRRPGPEALPTLHVRGRSSHERQDR